MLTIVVLAIASETGLGISVWGFIVSVQGGSLMDALAAVILFVVSALAMFLSYELVDQRTCSAKQRQRGNKDNRWGITLEPGQSVMFKIVPAQGQWTTTRIDPAGEDNGGGS